MVLARSRLLPDLSLTLYTPVHGVGAQELPAENSPEIGRPH